MSCTTDTVVQIDVTVTLDVRGNPHVTCTPYDAYVTAPSTLQFNLVTPGWAFPSSNAVYLNNPPNPNFPVAPVVVSSTQVTWQDVYASVGDFAYTACVQRSSDGAVFCQDPMIHNGTVSC